MLFGKRTNLFGLDIGSNALKLAEIRKTGKGYQLLNAGVMHLPHEAIVEGAIMNAPAVIDAIRNLLDVHKPESRNVATSVCGHSVIIKKVSLPLMSKEELEQSIQWEAEQYIPFNIHDVNLDYQILSPVAEKGEEVGSGQMDVLLVAAKKDLVEDYASLLREADLRPVIMDVASFAVENMYEVNADVDEDEVMAIFNIGASITNINIFKNGASLFTRDIHFGGNQFNEEIQKALNLSFQEAEYLKLGGSGREEDQREVQEILERITEVLFNETQRSLEFFSATSGSEKIHRVVLCGGCSALPGLAGKMEDRLGTPVDLADPFRRVIPDPGKFKPEYLKEIQPFMAVSVGLALRSVGD